MNPAIDETNAAGGLVYAERDHPAALVARSQAQQALEVDRRASSQIQRSMDGPELRLGAVPVTTAA